MKRFTILIVLIISLWFDAVSKPQQLYFENLSVKDGLSQISVLSLYQDSHGYMWFGTRDGLNRYNGQNFEIFLRDNADTLSLSDNYIKCITQDKQGAMWIGTSNGLNRFDPSTGKSVRYFITAGSSTGNTNEINALYFDSATNTLFIGTYYGLYRMDVGLGEIIKSSITERVFCITPSVRSLYIGVSSGLARYDISRDKATIYAPFKTISPTHMHNQVSVIFIDSRGSIWVSSGKKGLARLNSASLEIEQYVTGDNRSLFEIRDIKEDQYGNLIIGTYDGLRIYDPLSRSLTTYNQTDRSNGGLSHYAVERIFIDNAGIIWVGTYSGGVNYSNRQGRRFRYYNPNRAGHILGIVNAMAQYNGELWMGTEGGGIISFNIKEESFGYYPCSLSDGNSYKDNNVKSLYVDNDRLYAGLYTGWLHSFDLTSRRYLSRANYDYADAIYAIGKIAGQQGLLLGTYAPAGVKYFDKGAISTYDLSTKQGLVNVARISAMLPVSAQELYIGSRNEGLYIYDKEQMYHFTTDDKSGLAGNRITVISADSRGTILVGTSEGGLCIYDKKSKTFTSLTRNKGLRDDKICSIVEDRNGNVWVITRIGISLLDSKYNVVRTYDHSNGINVQEFSVNSALVTDDNTIYVGGDNGFISFNPEKLEDNSFSPPVVIHNVLANNKPLHLASEGELSIELKYDQANITIEYRALNFIYPDQNSYAYMLEGVDKDWHYVANASRVNYASLTPGSYTFRVKGSNNDGLWNNQGATLHIIIKPPFWRRGGAIVLYVVVLLSILAALFNNFRREQRLKQQVALKQQEQDMFKARIDLFTNFSHELRTPLTLIRGPVEDALQSSDVHKMSRSNLELILSNTHRLLLLVDQLMTFRKQESGSLNIAVAEGDFSGFVKEMEVAFGELARSKNIELRLECDSVNRIWYDRSMFEKVMMNLLSNAFKFTPEWGSIVIRLYRIDGVDRLGVTPEVLTKLNVDVKGYMVVEVVDSGKGIDMVDIERIFDPFYQSSDTEGGTGIGLSLTKGIVELHHGAIFAKNNETVGSSFVVVIPEGNDHFTDQQIIPDYYDSESISRYESVDTNDKKLPDAPTDHAIVVVEDNAELRGYIKSALQPYYKVIEAENGEQGRLHAVNHMPSLILSDIMMPVMDGLQMCRALKEDLRTSHIPIILLTARAYVLQMKEGLEFGADDYITKPFNTKLLLLKISNIISSRENLKNLYGKRLSLESMGVDISSSDDRFLQKLSEVVEKNITDPGLNIDRFCQEIGMSRASLYRKLMATTNMSPLRYIQSVRLHLAAKMLNETELSVSEISDLVGFSSLIHFSASFRKQYGVPPSKFDRRARKS